MRLQLSRVAHPVTVLGPGRRLGLWVQGCSIHCAGCASIDTWDPAGGHRADTEPLAAEIADLIVEARLSGLTITGGEPTEQSDALADLVVRVQRSLDERGVRPVDVLVFTGRTARAAAQSAPALWGVADAAVCGPYRADRPSDEPLTSSSNQRLVTLTPLGRSRFPSEAPLAGRGLQTHVADGEITLIGLPNPGDLPRLEEALRRRGITMEGRSWPTP